ncbi:MAG: hopanoid-associated sugar epimerase [Methylocystis sp.]|uniref:hopanoid-associated sugar epimerase n=1 Tax=Methylocystis sp. TaxID=1911079 RepID=UPI003D124A46
MAAGERALVTGASGFIGGAVVRKLLADGFDVRALVRKASPRDNIPASCEIAEGDVTDVASVRRAMAGTDVLFHLAANYRLWTPDPERVMGVNVRGTEIVMREAFRAGVKRIVHTSSVATLAPEGDAPCTEQNRLSPERAVGAYKRSKILSERLVEELVKNHGLPAVIVCPSAPLGSGDLKPTPTGRIVAEALRGGIPAYVDTGLNIAHVEDVAAGHVAALRYGEIGERYILGGENLTLQELLIEISRVSGRAPPLVKLPYWPLIPLAYANEIRARFVGSEPFLNRDSLRLSTVRMFVDDSKARRELNYQTRPAAVAIAAAVRWFGADAVERRGRRTVCGAS